MKTRAGLLAQNATAVVRSEGGRVVLDDPVALGIALAIAKHTCRFTVEGQMDRVSHFVGRIAERGMDRNSAAIAIINVDDPHGGPLAAELMPGHDWQAYRDRDEVPFARGLVIRAALVEYLQTFDADASRKLGDFRADAIPVVVVDHGVADVFAVKGGVLCE